jgi:hypothetical protein
VAGEEVRYYPAGNRGGEGAGGKIDPAPRERTPVAPPPPITTHLGLVGGSEGSLQARDIVGLDNQRQVALGVLEAGQVLQEGYTDKAGTHKTKNSHARMYQRVYGVLSDPRLMETRAKQFPAEACPSPRVTSL